MAGGVLHAEMTGAAVDAATGAVHVVLDADRGPLDCAPIYP